MALSRSKLFGWAKVGAIAGAATPFILKGLATLVSSVSFQIQSAINVNVGSGLASGSSAMVQFVQSIVGEGFSAIFGMPLVAGAIGGALVTVLGAYLVDAAGFLEGDKFKQMASALVVGGLVAGWLVAWSINLPTATTMIAMGLDALIIALIWTKVLPELGLDVKKVL